MSTACKAKEDQAAKLESAPKLPEPTAVEVKPVPSGPFGVTAGMPIDKLIGLGFAVAGKQLYIGKRVPVQNDMFEAFVVFAGDKTGLCKITGNTKSISSNGTGAAVRAEFDSMVSLLAAKYGRPDINIDTLSAGAIWKEPGEWMMSLLKDERTLISAWTKQNPNVQVKAYSEYRSLGYLGVTYEFDNFDKCKAEADSSNSNGL